MGNCFRRDVYNTRGGTLIPTLADVKDRLPQMGGSFSTTLRRNNSTKAEPVLPTLLERTVSDESERERFEEYLRDTEGAFYMTLFKPLMYFELSAMELPKASSVLAKLYSRLYITPNTEDLIQGPIAKNFDEFLHDESPTPASFTKLKEAMDKMISNRYLLGFKREHLQKEPGIRNSVDSNKELDISRQSGKIFSSHKSLKRNEFLRGSGSMVDMMDSASILSDDRSLMGYNQQSNNPDPVRVHNPMAGDF